VPAVFLHGMASLGTPRCPTDGAGKGGNSCQPTGHQRARDVLFREVRPSRRRLSIYRGGAVERTTKSSMSLSVLCFVNRGPRDGAGARLPCVKSRRRYPTQPRASQALLGGIGIMRPHSSTSPQLAGTDFSQRAYIGMSAACYSPSCRKAAHSQPEVPDPDSGFETPLAASHGLTR
jgi:hypothetical protein